MLIEGPSTRSYPGGRITAGEVEPPDLLPGRTTTIMPTIGSNDKPRIGTISEDIGRSSIDSLPQTLTTFDEHDLMVAERPQKTLSKRPRVGFEIAFNEDLEREFSMVEVHAQSTSSISDDQNSTTSC
jgi:hypothetical protein